MSKPFALKKTSRKVELFKMFEWEVDFGLMKGDYFHLRELGELNYHNAYDANETCILFRADALFIHSTYKEPIEVPVIAVKSQPTGDWTWAIRFQPPLAGVWQLRLRVFSSHPPGKRCNTIEKCTVGKQTISRCKREWISDNPVFTFEVIDKNRKGPIQAPTTTEKENHQYFYREIKTKNGQRKRHPAFIIGMARPWAKETPVKAQTVKGAKDKAWHNHMERRRELFKKLRSEIVKDMPQQILPSTLCPVVYHWMAPWESLLVHQMQGEFWPKTGGGTAPTGGKAVKLDPAHYHLGYCRYDQGRANRTDQIFNHACEHDILLYIVVMPHGLVRDDQHSWCGFRFGKKAEQLEAQGSKVKKYDCCSDIPEPSQRNGFQLFDKMLHNTGQQHHDNKATKSTISVAEFFQMTPETTAEDWKRQLWKHYANFWRYVIGRWGAHEAMGAWVLVDERDGVGSETNWWWKKASITRAWHDNVMKLLRRSLTWGTWQGHSLRYTGDYLKHPITSSETDYTGKIPDERKRIINSLPRMLRISWSPKARNHGFDMSEPAPNPTAADIMIERFGELKGHGDWDGYEQKLDFVSHHAYHVVPTWDSSGNFTGWVASNRVWFKSRKNNCKKIPPPALSLYPANQWLWESLCRRLERWSAVNRKKKRPMLITEYGCVERDSPNENYDKYGKRYPAYLHFANWAALSLGHAGTPFKWNDGKEFGEMAGRKCDVKGRPLPPWDPVNRYPVDNYAELRQICNFMRKIELSDLTFVEQSGFVRIAPRISSAMYQFEKWALSTPSRSEILVWIYERKFKLNGKDPQHDLIVTVGQNLNGKDYSVEWYPTWPGTSLSPSAATGAAKVNNGTLRIRMPPFPKSSLKTDNASGNDIALRLSDTTSKPR